MQLIKFIDLNAIQSKIRILIRKNPTLFKIWLSIMVGENHFPSKQDDLHLTGYQRSGNTFAMRLLKKAMPCTKICTHLHTISSIKIALRYGIPVVVLIREPSQAIASSILKRVDAKDFSMELAIAYDIDEYLEYYSFVLENVNRLTLVDFDFLTKEPENFISLVNSKIPNVTIEPSNIEAIINDVINSLKNDKREDGDRNFRSKYKDSKKEEILNIIGENYKLKECTNLKLQLAAHVVV